MEDFTREMQANDNYKVNELCGCNASQLTYSRRTDRTLHSESCSYRTFIEGRIRNLIIETFPANEAQKAAAASGIKL